jgi:hypothetical protein
MGRVNKASALLEVRAAQAAFESGREKRDEAVVTAIRAGSRLREVAEAAGISHEAVRRIARVLSVEFELGDELYEVTDYQADVFVYKLAGFNVGKFPGDRERFNMGTDWLPAAGELAQAIERVRGGEEEGPISLDGSRGAWGLALYQVLNLSYMDRPSDVSRLFDGLVRKYGK